ncbi:hypothetical protein WICMUC_000432 [Wickerhamomyces mucosus]|uniref:SUN domain-containing protein n=1 Tax=Wickerhamomyces mucosus TaxID=1378264 RepID=A0A9P8TIN8_9ASCO|nr:hypothetical protein WICMUC_000432 [Wickerhamomyces mucosus]
MGTHKESHIEIDDEYDITTDDEFEIENLKIDVTKLNSGYKKFKQDDYLESIIRYIFRKIVLIKPFIKYLTIIIIIIPLILIFITINQFKSPTQISNGSINNNKIFDETNFISKLNNLQFQINEINKNQRNKWNDFQKFIDNKLIKINNNFQKIDKDIIKIIDQKLQNLNSIDFANLKINNDDKDIGKIPIFINNKGEMEILPEFEHYLSNFISSQIEGQPFNEKFNFNNNSNELITKYFDSYLNNNLKYLTRDEILKIISEKFHESKQLLISEIKKSIPNQPSINYSPLKSITPKNYLTFDNGARIINYLTTSRLASTILTNSEESFHCDSTNNCSIGIKFLTPIYINEINYIHGSGILPNNIEIWVKVNDMSQLKLEFDQILHQPLEFYKGFVKIGELLNISPNLNNKFKFNTVEILKKYLTNSIIFTFNNGDIYKFQVLGMTKYDLIKIKEIIT